MTDAAESLPMAGGRAGIEPAPRNDLYIMLTHWKIILFKNEKHLPRDVPQGQRREISCLTRNIASSVGPLKTQFRHRRRRVRDLERGLGYRVHFREVHPPRLLSRHITEVTVHSGAPTTKELKNIGLSIGSKMISSSIYTTNPQLDYKTETLEIYKMGNSRTFIFKTFYVGTSDEFVINKGYFCSRFDIMYGNSIGGALFHEGGWTAFIYGGANLFFKNKTGISYTLESFPSVLNTDNFEITFSFGSFYLGGEPQDETGPWPPLVSVSGVVDKIKIRPFRESFPME